VSKVKVIAGRYGILVGPNSRLLGEVFISPEAAQRRADELGPKNLVVHVDVITQCAT
jgi:ssRNA-specific RNase YbeY (16S rRNA maturation enzyme)